MDQSFIVVEPDPVVRMDLTGTLEHNFPTGSVMSFTSAGEVCPLLETLAMPAWIFINGALISDLGADIVRSIVDAGGKFVSIGRSVSEAVPVTVLETPFTMSMILDALSIGANDPPALRPEAHT